MCCPLFLVTIAREDDEPLARPETNVLMVSHIAEAAFRGHRRSLGYELAGGAERLFGIAVELRWSDRGNPLLTRVGRGSRYGTIVGHIRCSRERNRHFHEWDVLRRDFERVLTEGERRATLRPMTNYESARLGGSPFGHSMATPEQVLVQADAGRWGLVPRGGPLYMPPPCLGATGQDTVSPAFSILHELGHDGQLLAISPFGEPEIIRRINGARAAVGLPIRSSRMPHSSLFVYPNEDVRDDEQSLFNFSRSYR